MKDRLRQTREDARLAAEKNESNCANQRRQNQRQSGECRKQPSRGKRVALKEKRERNADRGAKQNRQDRNADAGEDRFQDDALRKRLRVVGQ